MCVWYSSFIAAVEIMVSKPKQGRNVHEQRNPTMFLSLNDQSIHSKLKDGLSVDTALK